MAAGWTQIGKGVIPVSKHAFENFQRHNAQWLAAAIAYFTTFAIAPLIIILVEIAGVFLGRHRDVLDQVYAYLAHTAGPSAAGMIRAIVGATFGQKRAGLIAQIVGWVVITFAAIGLFGALQQALNTVWDVQPKRNGFVQAIRSRVLSFAVVLAIAFLLLVSLTVNTTLAAGTEALVRVFPWFAAVLKVVDFLLSFGVITLLFALLFKCLPECSVRWRDVWLGAAVTALLFVIGQSLLSWYLGRAGISSTYGAFGGLVVFLIWVNYSAQIMLFGAELTHVLADRDETARTTPPTVHRSTWGSRLRQPSRGVDPGS